MVLDLGYRDPNSYTLGEIAEKRINLHLQCTRCKHVAAMDVAKIKEEYGSRTRIPSLIARCRCRKCGKRNSAVALFRIGERKRDWWPRSPITER